ncbi:MAG: SET domain-containing protein [Desulfovibrionaceae bacterium]|nr:SET domain-containing protein [Desulfovibrionaceae bacterium]
MIHPHTTVQAVSPTIGNGVFATRDIPMGTIVVVRDRFDACLSRTDFFALPSVVRDAMETYMYHDRDGRLVLSWDHARYMNHNCCPNTMMTGYHLEIAVRDIHAGEEITTEYGLLNIQEPYDIHCGCPNCRHRLRLDDIDSYGDQWDRQIKRALLAVPKQEQPLWDILEPKAREKVLELQHDPDSYFSVKNLKWRLG